jgi:outer membrane protein TolC
VRAESGVADKIEGVIVSQTALRDRERELKQIVNQPGLGLATATILVPASEPNVLHYQLDTPRLIRAALDGRMEMLESEIAIATGRENVEFARNGLLPLLTVDYTYNVNALGGTLSDAFQTLRSKRFEDHSVAVNLQVPLGNAAARAQLRQAQATRLQAIATKAQRSLLIENDVLGAIDQLEANWQRILAAGRRVILAARVVDLETRQFDQGLRTSTDVLDAQTALANAQSAEIAALSEYQIAQIDLAFATGTLLGASGVGWAPTRVSEK